LMWGPVRCSRGFAALRSSDAPTPRRPARALRRGLPVGWRALACAAAPHTRRTRIDGRACWADCWRCGGGRGLPCVPFEIAYSVVAPRASGGGG